ncbi:helix-turn-helix transcriptional regulator [Sphingomonas sp. QA11]|uniref:winged helix-turn-helix transcriptional regulator n=1 Tax=Sphingomonas sp. QA11 TaxID=2950605 RepID=UPI00234A21E6|nr:helix-turn-helix domain-containing protein [Sphingomonas sp. QA11]WCM27389.1 helix-turn-helix transcriptional regulator [Sphingomonas sp. QA11]
MNRLSSLPIERALQVIGGRWKLFIVFHLLERAQRPGRLERLIPGISQKVLLQQLRELEEHGLVSKTIFAESPVRVEYALTPLGETVAPVIDMLHRWGIEQSRAVGELHRLTLCDNSLDVSSAQ